jgi:CRP-like cAMP-binding protein
MSEFTKDDTIAFLRNTRLFTALSEDTLRVFAALSVIKKFDRDQVIHLAGDKAHSFYVVKEGWVKLFHETLDGAEAVMDILTTGHTFGESSIFDKDKYVNNAQCVEDSVLFVMPAALLKEYIQKDPSLALNMFSSMSRHRKNQDMEIEHLAVQNASQRIGCFLLRLCPRNKTEAITLQLPYDKILLASRLSMKPETFSRALNTLREKTGIRISGAQVEIDHINQLSEFSCGACSSSYPCADV